MAVIPTYIIHFHHFRRILEAAQDAGIDVAPLKGAHLLTSVYNKDENERLISDVDFLVRPEDWERTLELMTSLGMRPRQRKHDERETHEVGFLLDSGGERGILFEPHRYLFNPRRFPIDHVALWERSRPSTFEGAPCRRLSTEDHIVHMGLHSAIHRLMVISKSVRDIEALVRRGNPDFDTLVARAREWRATRVVWLFLSLLEEELPELYARAEQLRPPVIPRAVLSFLMPNRSETRLSHLHHRVQAALLWPWLMDSPVQVARFVVHHPRVLGGRIARETRGGGSSS